MPLAIGETNRTSFFQSVQNSRLTELNCSPLLRAYSTVPLH